MWIDLDGVCAGRRTGQPEAPVLRGVSLALERGEYVAILGPSGAGKSSLLFVLGCLVRPEAGHYWLDGTRVEKMSEARLARLRGRRIGFVFESAALIPELTALENVEVPLLYQRIDRSERLARAVGILGELGMGTRLRRRPGELSPGDRQRVALARACACGPELLVVDEPTRGLDARSGDEIMDLLESRSALGVTVVVATQDPARGRRARRLVQMRDGRVVRELAGGLRFGRSAQVVRRLRGRARRR
ncbi:MAG: ABC transporter ATP-binding protein [Myxococcales bacterium]|nr:MAG: ABC transporter ATP-binding protein [Myxococcales bacterium]